MAWHLVFNPTAPVKAPFTCFVAPVGQGPDSLMAHRKFTDLNGLQWEAYDVVSSAGFGRPGEPQLAPQSEVFRAVRIWLMFESATGKRRLPSIPDDWDRASESELQRLLSLATPVSKDSH